MTTPTANNEQRQEGPPQTTIRLTHATAVVVAHLLRNPDGEQYGSSLMRLTGLNSGKVYAILRRLHRAGLITIREEYEPPEANGDPYAATSRSPS